MQTVVIVIHLMIVATLIATVLLQKSEGGGLGIGGGAGFMSSRGTANLLTRTTAVLAVGFFITSLFLSWLASYNRAPTSIINPPVPVVKVAPDADGPMSTDATPFVGDPTVMAELVPRDNIDPLPFSKRLAFAPRSSAEARNRFPPVVTTAPPRTAKLPFAPVEFETWMSPAKLPVEEF